MNAFLLKLYITGRTVKSDRAIFNLHQLCEAHLKGRYEIVIIDLLEDPQVAERERIMATPTLIKLLPPPIRRIIGDLSDCEKLMLGLGIHAEPARDQQGDVHS